MNFTREPIIETVITPREGCKLVVRSSKGVSQEDYFVDAVEVVSFGHSFFFRSQERPKSFLVPVSDYEILELKETRMPLKNVSTERSIKIGGGREAPPRPREESPQDAHLAESRPAPSHSSGQQDQQPRDRKRDNKRRRGRRGRDRDRQDMQQGQPPREMEPEERSREEDYPTPEDHQPSQGNGYPADASAGGGGEEKAPSFISKLFPPPPTLIKESLTRYKPAETGDEAPSKEKLEHPPQRDDSEDDDEE